MRFSKTPALTAMTILTAWTCLAAGTPRFERIQVTGDFYSEGADVGDFNRDGHMDIVAGPFWFAGPRFDFSERHAFTRPPESAYDPNGYSDFFLTYTHDFNGDGWDDILVYSWPGKGATWHENPKNKQDDPNAFWPAHMLFEVADNESPALGDMNGDGKPELIFHTAGRLGYGEIDWGNPAGPATFNAVSGRDPKRWFRYTHGYGYGDVNGDGRPDILAREGWWEQPSKEAGSAGPWLHHPVPFAPAGKRGGAQMHVYDVNGDGLNDVITSLDAHGYGLAWYEQVRPGSGRSPAFREHVFMNETPEQNKYGVKFSQLHSLDLVDMDGDGLKDIVTGKRFWAHGPNGDAEPGAPAVLYWFKLVRNQDGVDWVPHLIDDDSGVGTQITAKDINQDGLPDVISSNKKGIHLFVQKR